MSSVNLSLGSSVLESECKCIYGVCWSSLNVLFVCICICFMKAPNLFIPELLSHKQPFSNRHKLIICFFFHSRASSMLRWWLSAAERSSTCRWGGSAWWCWCSSNSNSRRPRQLLQRQEDSVLLQTSQLLVAWTTLWEGQTWASQAPSSLVMEGVMVSLLTPNRILLLPGGESMHCRVLAVV